MPRIAYCSSCGRYVELSLQGECSEGHPRSALRDVREGTLKSAPVVRSALSAPTAEEAAFRGYNSVWTKLAGKAIIFVPVALVLAWGLWTGMEQLPGFGMPFWARLGWSVFSLVLTIGGAFFFAGLRNRH